MLAPLAAGFLALVHAGLAPGAAALGASAADTALLLLAGPVTGLPLILFAASARHLTYATTGLVTYLNPTLQVASAVLVLGETLTPAHATALGLIWAGLALYTLELRRAGRAARAAAAAGQGAPHRP
jgi:chloramphenicol-sensitive protein RarD